MRNNLLRGAECFFRTATPGILVWFVGLSIPAPAQTPRSINLGAAQYFSFTTSPAWVLGDHRNEFRLHSFSQRSVDYFIFQDQRYSCRILANSLSLQCIDNQDSKDVTLSLSGRTDVRVRLMRSLATHVFSFEIWDGNGSNYAIGVISFTGTSQPGITANAWILANFGAASGGGQLAFWRWYSTVVPIGSAPPAELPSAAADHGDFRFENSLTDSGSAGLTLTLNGGGSAVYTNSPTYPPVAKISPTSPARASKPVTLVGSTSFTALLGNGLPTFFWQQLDGPAIGRFNDHRVATPIFTPPLAGLYVLQLTVTDALGQTSIATDSIGALATDDSGVVITGNATLDRLMGPLTRSGTSPWPYYDIAEKGLGDSIATAALSNPPTLGVKIRGTVQVTNRPALLIGTDTHFTEDLTLGMTIIIAWDTVDGPGTGRLTTGILSIQDDTHATTNLFDVQIVLGSGFSVYGFPSNGPHFQAGWWGLNAGAGTNSWNYYDVALAQYRLYYRTGETRFLNYARAMADYWWQWGIDHGSAGVVPRAAAMQSQFIRAYEGFPERLPGLYKLVDYYINALNMDVTGPKADGREAGYTHWYVALGAQSDPDPIRHAQYCNWLVSKTPQWITYQNAQGFWSEDNFATTFGYPYLPPGASPWRSDIPIHGLQAAYESLIDSSPHGCYEPTLAAQTLTAIQKAVDFTHNYGRSGNRGVYYSVQYATSAQVATFPSGAVSVNFNSQTVTGVGTTFSTAFRCNGTDYIGFEQTRTVYKVTGCTDNTHLTISPAYGAQAETSIVTGSTFAQAPQASTSCPTSLASFCEFGPDGDRNLTRLMPGITGWLYYYTGNPKYLAWGDDWFSAAFGGPANGPGGLEPCAGPLCDGFETDYSGSLTDCNTNGRAPPCFFGGNVYSYLGKNFGQGSGAPAAQTHLAYRLGGASPAENPTVWVDVLLAGVPGASKIQLNVTQPSGVTTSTTCSSSPCPVTVDARQGDHLMQIVYLSAADDVLATGDSAVLRVP